MQSAMFTDQKGLFFFEMSNKHLVVMTNQKRRNESKARMKREGTLFFLVISFELTGQLVQDSTDFWQKKWI